MHLNSVSVSCLNPAASDRGAESRAAQPALQWHGFTSSRKLKRLHWGHTRSERTGWVSTTGVGIALTVRLSIPASLRHSCNSSSRQALANSLSRELNIPSVRGCLFFCHGTHSIVLTDFFCMQRLLFQTCFLCGSSMLFLTLLDNFVRPRAIQCQRRTCVGAKRHPMSSSLEKCIIRFSLPYNLPKHSDALCWGCLIILEQHLQHNRTGNDAGHWCVVMPHL